jgi:protein SCO1
VNKIKLKQISTIAVALSVTFALGVVAQSANASSIAKSGSTSSAAVPAPGGGTYLNFPIPASILKTQLFDTNGSAISLNTFKGKWVVLSDFLTSCQEICPMTSANMEAIANTILTAKLNGKASVLEVSVDGWRDTASRLKAYQNLFNDNSWTIAGGTTSNLNKLWHFFGVSISKDPYTASDMKKLPVDWQTGKVNTFDISHTDAIIIISPDQKWSWLDLGTPDIGNGKLPTALKAFLDEDGLKNLVKPENPTWTTAATYSALNHFLGSKLK